MIEQGSADQHTRLLRAWHLAILRFALTRDNADRLSVRAIANEIDKLGRQHQAREGFSFFRKTSTELCVAILRRQEDDAVILNRYLTQVDDAGLQRSLAAALDIPEPVSVSNPVRKRTGPNPDLWRGLPSRAGARS
jgi:hypothetical protein